MFRHRCKRKSRRLTTDLATKQPNGLRSSWRHEMLTENSRLGRHASRKLNVLCLSVRFYLMQKCPQQSRPSDGTSSVSACACAESCSVSFVTCDHCFLAITHLPCCVYLRGYTVDRSHKVGAWYDHKRVLLALRTTKDAPDSTSWQHLVFELTGFSMPAKRVVLNSIFTPYLYSSPQAIRRKREQRSAARRHCGEDAMGDGALDARGTTGKRREGAVRTMQRYGRCDTMGRKCHATYAAPVSPIRTACISEQTWVRSRSQHTAPILPAHSRHCVVCLVT